MEKEDKKKSQGDYSGTSIQVLEGLQAVRKRPGMYIGAADYNGLHQLIWEILDNSIDEAISGHGKKIYLTIKKDESIQISDEGRGIPYEMHATSKKSTLETVFAILHAGGKFDDKSYAVASGLHGVGASVVNALSEYLTVTTYHGYKIHTLTFKRGVANKEGLLYQGATTKNGTIVTFKPDNTIFEVVEFDYEFIKKRLIELSYLLDGIEFILKDERSKKEEHFIQHNGLTAYVNYLAANEELLFAPISFDNENLFDETKIRIKTVFTYTGQIENKILSYVNNISTYDGGTHETGLKNAFTKAFNEYARDNNLLKSKDKNFDGEDVREGLICVLSIYVPENIIQFGNQIKSKLTSPKARATIENFIYNQLSYYLKENSVTAKALTKKMINSMEARTEIRKQKKEKNNVRAFKLNGKLSPAQLKNARQLELFLVEGDSAGGSAKSGRDSKYQAILPLKGKVANAENKSLSSLLENEEFQTIVHTVGTGIGKDFNIRNLNYHKVIIMTDADNDGAHIQILLITLFYRHMKQLIEQGHVYIAQPPLYKIVKQGGKTFRYCFDENELRQAKSVFKTYLPIQRYKGLGEMNPDQLWETTMNPETRSLIKLAIDDAEAAEHYFNVLMGEASSAKKQFIEDNVEFDADQFGGKDNE